LLAEYLWELSFPFFLGPLRVSRVSQPHPVERCLPLQFFEALLIAEVSLPPGEVSVIAHSPPQLFGEEEEIYPSFLSCNKALIVITILPIIPIWVQFMVMKSHKKKQQPNYFKIRGRI